MAGYSLPLGIPSQWLAILCLWEFHRSGWLFFAFGNSIAVAGYSLPLGISSQWLAILCLWEFHCSGWLFFAFENSIAVTGFSLPLGIPSQWLAILCLWEFHRSGWLFFAFGNSIAVAGYSLLAHCYLLRNKTEIKGSSSKHFWRGDQTPKLIYAGESYHCSDEYCFTKVQLF